MTGEQLMTRLGGCAKYARWAMARLAEGKPVSTDPFGLNAALAERRAARPARQEAARRAAQTRRGGHA